MATRTCTVCGKDLVHELGFKIRPWQLEEVAQAGYDFVACSQKCVEVIRTIWTAGMDTASRQPPTPDGFVRLIFTGGPLDQSRDTIPIPLPRLIYVRRETTPESNPNWMRYFQSTDRTSYCAYGGNRPETTLFMYTLSKTGREYQYAGVAN
jgi:hypothetical protein